MKNILLLLLIFIIGCGDQQEIFPNMDLDDNEIALINATIDKSDTIPISLKVNYVSDFNYYIKSFKNSTYSLDGIFNSSQQIVISSVYDSVEIKTDSITIGVRNSDNEFINKVIDTIYTFSNNGVLNLNDIEKINTAIYSVNGTSISTSVFGDSARLGTSKLLYVSLKNKNQYKQISYIVSKGILNSESILNLTKFSESPDTLLYFSLNADSSLISKSTTTKNQHNVKIVTRDVEKDSIREYFSSTSNFITDSIVIIDSVSIERFGNYRYTIKNRNNSSINFDDSIMLSIYWDAYSNNVKLFETVVQKKNVWTLDSIYKVVDGEVFTMNRLENEFIDTVYLFNQSGNSKTYEYYSKKRGYFYGVSKKIEVGINQVDSCFVGNSFVYRDISSGRDTTNIFLHHYGFKDFSGIYSRSDKSFFIFDVNEDKTVLKK